MSALAVSIRNAANGTVLQLNGDLDFHTAPQVREALAALTVAPGHLLVLDLEHLDFCDSTGITLMIAARNYAHTAGAHAALAAVPRSVRRILAVVGLDQVLDTHPDVDHALASRTG